MYGEEPARGTMAQQWIRYYLLNLSLRILALLHGRGFRAHAYGTVGKWRAGEGGRERERPTREGLMKTGYVRVGFRIMLSSCSLSRGKGKIKPDMARKAKSKGGDQQTHGCSDREAR